MVVEVGAVFVDDLLSLTSVLYDVPKEVDSTFWTVIGDNAGVLQRVILWCCQIRDHRVLFYH